MASRYAWTSAAATFLLLLLCATSASAQQDLVFDSGQNVVPVFEGWQKNPDGTFKMYFGYLNRNYRENLNIPVGDLNSFEPAGADRGQPTYFYPRRQLFVFAVPLPKDWGNKDLIWTLTAYGKTEKAYGSLVPNMEVDLELILKNNGSLSFNLELGESDKPPSVRIAPPAEAKISSGLPLSATVSDDGIPQPRAPRQRTEAPSAARETTAIVNVPVPPTPRRLPSGLSIRWMQYRGPGDVTFDTDAYVAVANNGKATTTARFSKPGVYVIRAIASDSMLDTVEDVTVSVK